ncbi:1,4-alpha-glucan branching protein GlgB [Devriesea agamarum]|uniref:1,4-alpha-glucan branching protein GlgB n=1 Tax=Devriesea agamarum TaxID=472569 RepID=UPI000A03F51D|nr:1,4-alpha-glucan branching protein GlgB [Devriesea agamarum]
MTNDDTRHTASKAEQRIEAGAPIMPASQHVLGSVATGSYHDPHSVLGVHRYKTGVTLRVLAPLAHAVEVVLPGSVENSTQGISDGPGDRVIPLEHEYDGIWVVALTSDWIDQYRVRITWAPGHDPVLIEDPYRFLPTVGELDLHLIAEGRHEELWRALGARTMRHGGVEGTSFTVWAPNAQAVQVIGSFNGWDGRRHCMRTLGSSGVWELFIPGVGNGTVYKLRILGPDGTWRDKADPMARHTEVPPATGSVVVTSEFTWNDNEYLIARADRDPHTSRMSVYEVHLGSWRPGLDYRQLADELVEYVTDLGFTHVEFLPVAEHPFGGSWGYQVTSYYAPTSRFGSPDDFRYLIDALHRANIGVILDWVPAHFPKDEWALARFDGTCLYEHPDPRRGEHPDWGTLIFDVGRREVRNFLVANACYWLEEFHIDGLRVDAVASMLYLDYSRADGQWLPNIHGGRENLEAIDFLQEVNATVYKRVPGVVMIAEESTSFPGVTKPTDAGGLGFGLKWNMGWMHDTLSYIGTDPVHRQYHHNELTFSMVYQYSENFILPISHDEVVHGKASLLRKTPGDEWQQHATLRAYLAFMWTHPGKQLLFMGSEFAQGTEWSETLGLQWWLLDYPLHRGAQQLVRDLNRLEREQPALWALDHDPAGFEWLISDDSGQNVLVFLRKDDDGNCALVAVNFSSVPWHDYHVPLPEGGEWVEVLNTDAPVYGGGGVGNLGRIHAEGMGMYGRPCSARLSLPPLGAVVFVPARQSNSSQSTL